MLSSLALDTSIPLAGLIEESIVDGPGLRFVIFTQGCKHKCKGCQNPQTHPLAGGTQYTLKKVLELYAENPLLSGITFSGGEPFLHAEPLSYLAHEIHNLGGDVISYTGYTFEDLLKIAKHDQGVVQLLEQADLLIDGPYIEELRDLDLLFRGSSNQRVLTHQDRAAIVKNLLEPTDPLYSLAL